ncbi:MAG: hypothetical protein WA430_06030, partial [Acidobacteriaceae bacterium]
PQTFLRTLKIKRFETFPFLVSSAHLDVVIFTQRRCNYCLNAILKLQQHQEHRTTNFPDNRKVACNRRNS